MIMGFSFSRPRWSSHRESSAQRKTLQSYKDQRNADYCIDNRELFDSRVPAGLNYLEEHDEQQKCGEADDFYSNNSEASRQFQTVGACPLGSDSLDN